MHCYSINQYSSTYTKNMDQIKSVSPLNKKMSLIFPTQSPVIETNKSNSNWNKLDFGNDLSDDVRACIRMIAKNHFHNNQNKKIKCNSRASPNINSIKHSAQTYSDLLSRVGNISNISDRKSNWFYGARSSLDQVGDTRKKLNNLKFVREKINHEILI